MSTKKEPIPIPEFCGNHHFIKFYVLPKVEFYSNALIGNISKYNNFYEGIYQKTALGEIYRKIFNSDMYSIKRLMALSVHIYQYCRSYDYWDFQDNNYRIRWYHNRYLIGRAFAYAVYYPLIKILEKLRIYSNPTLTNSNYNDHITYYCEEKIEIFDSNLNGYRHIVAPKIITDKQSRKSLKLPKVMVEIPNRKTILDFLFENYTQTYMKNGQEDEFRNNNSMIKLNVFLKSNILRRMYNYLHIKAQQGEILKGYEFFLTLSGNYNGGRDFFKEKVGTDYSPNFLNGSMPASLTSAEKNMVLQSLSNHRIVNFSDFETPSFVNSLAEKEKHQIYKTDLEFI